MPPGPGLRKWTEYLSPGPGGMPLALRLSDWLGHTKWINGALVVVWDGSPDLSWPCLPDAACNCALASRARK